MGGASVRPKLSLFAHKFVLRFAMYFLQYSHGLETKRSKERVEATDPCPMFAGWDGMDVFVYTW